MNRQVSNEIPPGWKPGGIVLLDMDPGFRRSWAGTNLLEDCLREAGLRKKDVAILRSPEPLARLQPNIVVALGPEAAEASIGGGWAAKDVDDRRGYLFEGLHGFKVLPTVHPEKAAKAWTPWRILLSYDLQKAKANAGSRHLRRPEREVRIVRSRSDARSAVAELRSDGLAACDIENYDERTLACVGFAGRGHRAFVFPAEMLDECKELLEDPAFPLIFQNGQYDVYFLRVFCGVETRGFDHDIMLQWHACYPELAGTSQKSGAKRTHKSLAFFSSLYTTDAWWKDYDFQTEEERFVLNGRDCCITFEVHQKQAPLLDSLGVRRIYRHEMRLLEPCMRMLERGLRVDEELRTERLTALEVRVEDDEARLQELIVPLLEERREALGESIRLFENIEGVCRCCRHAAKKQMACWSCAGFDKAPSKKELEEFYWNEQVFRTPEEAEAARKWTKAEFEAAVLKPCSVCAGVPRKEWLEFNPASTPQKAMLLFDILKLPPRISRDGKVSTDADTLKNLLPKCA